MSTLESNNERLAQLMQQVHDLPPVANEDAVLRIPQELTDTQKWQARSNIGAASAEDVAGKMDKVTGTPDQVIGFDADGNPVAREAPSGGGGGNVEEIVMDLLVQMELAPVVLDENGALLADGNGAILLNL